MKKRRRFRGRRPKRAGARAQQLSKTARSLHSGGGLETWSERLAPREAISAGDAGTADEEPPELTPEELENAFPARVVSLASGLAWVEAEDGSGDAAEEPDEAVRTEPPRAESIRAEPIRAEPIQCVLPSAIARSQQASIAVGDLVLATPHGDEHRVLRVEPRRTYLARPDPLQPRARRVVAANIDLVVHLASVVEPPLRPNLVDRYLIAVQQGGAEAMVAVNKIDLVPQEKRRAALAPLDGYRGMLEILPVSAHTGEGLEALRELLRGRISVIVGHSGVGKSSIVNALDPSIDAATGAVSRALGVGRHTTTSSNLYHLAGGIRLIDTPGIREFGVWDLDAHSLAGYFPDFDDYSPACHFRDCSHSHEPRCAVRQAVEHGELPEARYRTYLRILASLDET